MVGLYMFIDKNTVKRAKNPVWVGDIVISNPTEKTLRDLGYTDMIFSDILPEITENEVIIPQYEFKDGVIIQTLKTEVAKNEFI